MIINTLLGRAVRYPGRAKRLSRFYRCTLTYCIGKVGRNEYRYSIRLVPKVCNDMQREPHKPLEYSLTSRNRPLKRGDIMGLTSERLLKRGSRRCAWLNAKRRIRMRQILRYYNKKIVAGNDVFYIHKGLTNKGK